MSVQRILSANWSGVYSSGQTTIEITQVSNLDATVLALDDEVAPTLEATFFFVARLSYTMYF